MPEVSVAALLDAAVEAIGGEARPGQTRMAQAVGAALDGGRHLLVQAGTGTGKSLAYLVPALVHAVRREERVVVATATLVLQRQIMEHDLPLARRAVGAALDREPKTALLKGRRNYVCRLKLDGAYGEDEDEALMGRAEAYRGTGSSFAAELGRLTAWARETETGDRDDVPGGVSGRAWNHVSVSAAQCLGAKCPLVGTCFAERAKALAMTADLVVTNHAMLAIQARLGAAADPESDAARAASVLPDHAALVIDEAHQLTESVTSALTGVLTPALVRHAAAQARRTAGKAAPLAEAGASLDRGADALEAAIDAAAPPGGVVRLDRGLPEAVGVAVTEVRAAARAAFSAVGGLKDADAAPKKAARAAFEELVELSDRLGQSGEGDGGGATQGWDGGDGIGREDVVWLSRNALGDGALSAAPLDVARDIGAGLMDQACAVMTSATLALGGQMEPAARAAGLAPGEWDGLDVGSPFDYGRQGIMYIAADLPAPGRGTDHRAAQQERLRELIEASGGGALGL
ncbi:MAG: ATP-dependent DNA helicase, partial [Bifidobacteriaceae bacterium]|nr:ATP-dependent DNA helicase [Bifidobacteriaceae bacterium]